MERSALPPKLNAQTFEAVATRQWRCKSQHKLARVLMPLIVCAVLLGGCTQVDRDNGAAIEKPDQIVLSWTENPATTQTVSWHGDTLYQGMAEANGRDYKATVTNVRNGEYYRYSAVMTGLLPGTTYGYRVGDGETWSEKHHFTTEKSGDFRFIFMP